MAYRQEKKEPKYYLIVVFVGLVTLAVIFAMLRPSLKPVSNECSPNNAAPSVTNVQLFSGSDKQFNLEFAKTTTQQELGLSDRPCFPKDVALLFLFPKDDRFGIWMKNMHFPIDVVWLDKGKKIITIEKDMKPASYPKVYYPTEDARYVVEFNSGTMNELQAHIGSSFNW